MAEVNGVKNLKNDEIAKLQNEKNLLQKIFLQLFEHPQKMNEDSKNEKKN